jgi:secretion/DNA translocation related TadE-like protein
VRSAQRGSVSIVVVALISVALVLAIGVADLARVLTCAARAQTAADAAALAAAQELASPSDLEPSDLAAAYAQRNGAVLTACSCDTGGTEAVVTVTVQVGPLVLAPDGRVVTARARAIVEIPA